MTVSNICAQAKNIQILKLWVPLFEKNEQIFFDFFFKSVQFYPIDKVEELRVGNRPVAVLKIFLIDDIYSKALFVLSIFRFLFKFRKRNSVPKIKSSFDKSKHYYAMLHKLINISHNGTDIFDKS